MSPARLGPGSDGFAPDLDMSRGRDEVEDVDSNQEWDDSEDESAVGIDDDYDDDDELDELEEEELYETNRYRDDDDEEY
jgi:hypothetical protein